MITQTRIQPLFPLTKTSTVHHGFETYWPEERSHLAKAKAAVQDVKKEVEEQAGKITSALKTKVA